MKARRRLLFLGAVAGAACLPPAVWAWGVEAHQVVGFIANDQLSKAAWTKVNLLLQQEPGATLASVSTWADEHSSQVTARWHVVDFPHGDCHYQPRRDCADGQCAVAAIARERKLLISAPSPQEQLKALKILVNLVADIHGPLNAGYADDREGNKFQVHWKGHPISLRQLWDTGLIKSLDLDALHLAAELQQGDSDKIEYPVTYDPADWAEESCRIVAAEGFYPANRNPDWQYALKWNSTLEARLQIAGTRLADLLNSTLGH